MGSKWEIFYEIAMKHSHEKEDFVQRLFEQVFAELFGYSRLFGEVETHRVLHIGSTDRAIPDIIIKDSTTQKDLFIVELKQLNLPRNPNYEDQLVSYMKLLSLKVGVLVCDAIYLYYLENNKAISSKISIKKDSNKGDTFMELFSKGNFAADKVRDFVMQEQQFDDHVQEIKKELEQLDIKDVVKLYFSSNFEEDEIDEALKNIDFVIRITNEHPAIPALTPKSNSRFVTRSDRELDFIPDSAAKHRDTIQDWIKRIFRYLLENKLLSDQDIYWLHDLEYSKKTFGIAYALFVDEKWQTKFKGRDRYWQTPIGGYYICSQWWLDRDNEYDSNIKRWLTKVLPNYVEHGLGRRY